MPKSSLLVLVATSICANSIRVQPEIIMVDVNLEVYTNCTRNCRWNVCKMLKECGSKYKFKVGYSNVITVRRQLGWVRNQRWRPITGNGYGIISHISVCIHDNNKIPTPMHTFSMSSNIYNCTIVWILSYVRVSASMVYQRTIAAWNRK